MKGALNAGEISRLVRRSRERSNKYYNTFVLFIPCRFLQLLHQPTYAHHIIPRRLTRHTSHTLAERDAFGS
jgi:hypothetical protein